MTDMQDLARRAVQSKSWRWMRGMSVVSDTDHDAVVWHDKSIVYVDQDDAPGFEHIEPTDLPDLSDQATLGCLLHLVREHWGDCSAHIRRVPLPSGGELCLCHAPFSLLQTHGATEAEALVKALELEVSND